jgi:hypothetical protein
MAAGPIDPAILALLKAFFDAVSFESGTRPAYERIYDLFVRDGRLMRASPGGGAEIWSIPEFIAPRQELVDSGRLSAFEEFEFSGRTDSFGGVAHRFSEYGKRGVTDGQPFEGRGVILTQFLRTAEGWRMTSMAWEDQPASSR